jgi:hypothetical protein
MSKANKAFLSPSPQKSQKHYLFKGNSKLMGNEILALSKKNEKFATLHKIPHLLQSVSDQEQITCPSFFSCRLNWLQPHRHVS